MSDCIIFMLVSSILPTSRSNDQITGEQQRTESMLLGGTVASGSAYEMLKTGARGLWCGLLCCYIATQSAPQNFPFPEPESLARRTAAGRLGKRRPRAGLSGILARFGAEGTRHPCSARVNQRAEPPACARVSPGFTPKGGPHLASERGAKPPTTTRCRRERFRPPVQVQISTAGRP
jgi:hypothetical protein